MKRLLSLVGSLLMVTWVSLEAAPRLAATSSQVLFKADFVYGEAYLRVTGPGDYLFEKIFSAEQSPAVELDPRAEDGLYQWELLLVEPLPARTRAALSTGLAEGVAVDRRSPDSRKDWGVFHLRGGAITVPENRPKQPPHKDLLLSDDMIIQGGLCVGEDCLFGERFGSDTTRFKDTVVRMHFEDTSTLVGMADNDWRFLFNDLADDGSSYFAIEDSTALSQVFRLDAGAPAQSLRVDQDGDLGLGTSAPAADLHLSRSSSPTLRLEQDGSGPAAQSWEVVGNEQAFSVVDVTDGDAIPFRIDAAAGAGRLTVDAEGDVGVGTTDPRAPLHVRLSGAEESPDNFNTVAVFQNTGSPTSGSIISVFSGNSSNSQIWLGDTDDQNIGRIVYRNGVDVLSLWSGDAERVRIDSVGDLCIGCNDFLLGADFIVGDTDVVASWLNAGDSFFTVTSSREAKENLAAVEVGDILEKVAATPVFTYDFKEGPDDRMGLIAEDFHGVFGRGSASALNGQEVQMALWLSVQELTARNDELRDENAQLAQRLAALETRLSPVD